MFFREFWEKQQLVVKRERRDYFDALLSLDEVDRVLTTLDLRYPNITLKNANRDVTADDYTVGGDSLDVAKVYQLFQDGATIALAYLDTVIPALTAFCRRLENEFSFPFQTNVYLTPARAQGAKPHYDTHDVFVLQVLGSKHWTIYGTPLELPLTNQDFDSSVQARGAPTLEFDLSAGDTAYIPRGVVHDAHSSEDVSLHITAGVLSYTWTDLLLEAVADAGLNESALRKTLPVGFARQGFDRVQARKTFRKLLQQVAAKSDFDAILDRFVDDLISKCAPPLRGQMAQMEIVGRLGVNSVVGARTGVVCRQRTGPESTSVECYGRKVTFPPQATEAVGFALGHSSFAVRELPGDLDDEGKLVVVRRLIREGLVMIHRA